MDMCLFRQGEWMPYLAVGGTHPSQTPSASRAGAPAVALVVTPQCLARRDPRCDPQQVGSTYPCFTLKHGASVVYFDATVPSSVYAITYASAAFAMLAVVFALVFSLGYACWPHVAPHGYSREDIEAEDLDAGTAAFSDSSDDEGRTEDGSVGTHDGISNPGSNLGSAGLAPPQEAVSLHAGRSWPPAASPRSESAPPSWRAGLLGGQLARSLSPFGARRSRLSSHPCGAADGADSGVGAAARAKETVESTLLAKETALL